MDPVTAIAISGGMNFVGGLFGRSAQKDAARRQAAQAKAEADRAFANQAAQTAYAAEFQNQMISQYNQRTTEEYDIRLGQYKQQLELNNQAAVGAFAAEQTRLNEQFAKAAFNRQSMIRELYRAQGMAAASGSGRASKSAKRANLLNTLGEFGRANAMLNRNLMSARRGSKSRMDALAGKHYQGDLSAWSKVAIAPRMMTPKTGAGPQLASPIAQMSVPGIGFGDIMSAGLGAAAGAMSTYAGGLKQTAGGNWVYGGT